MPRVKLSAVIYSGIFELAALAASATLARFRLANYMFDSCTPLWIRGSSLFHLWMHPLLLWMVRCYGYDWHGWIAQSVVAAIVIPLSYWCSPREENVNWVHGFGKHQQIWMPQWLYIVVLMIGFPLRVYSPSHLALGVIMPHRK